MADFVEKSGKTVDEAVEAALLELHLQKADVMIEILEEPSRGFFGLIGKRSARVRVTPLKTSLLQKKEAEQIKSVPVPGANTASETTKTAEKAPAEENVPKSEEAAAEDMPVEQEDCPPEKEEKEASPSSAGEKQREPANPAVAAVVLDKADNFLQQIFRVMELKVEMEKKVQQSHAQLNLSGRNLGILIGKHGQTLDALQYLVNLAANQGMTEERVRIILDIEGYRSRREETLRRLAARLAERSCRTNQRIVLEPMNRHERKIIHMALQENYRVLTYSAGDEPFRKVVIEPKHRVSRTDGRLAEEDY